MSLDARTFPNLNGLPGFSSSQVEEHLALYRGYVKQVNALDAAIAGLAAKGERGSPAWAGLVRQRGFAMNGLRLHELYFEALTIGPAALRPESALGSALAHGFGSVDGWRDDFTAIAAMRGVGWAMLSQDPVTGRLVNHWVDLHDEGHLAGFRPLLALDLWEHAYLIDYLPAHKSEYVTAVLSLIDWRRCEARLAGPVRAAA